MNAKHMLLAHRRTFWLRTALLKRLAWCMKDLVKESPESELGDVTPLRGDCLGVSISAATERRRGTMSSISSGGCLLKAPTLQAMHAV